MLESLGARHGAAINQCWGLRWPWGGSPRVGWVGLSCCWLRKCIFCCCCFNFSGMVLDNQFSKINSMRGNPFVNLSLLSWKEGMVCRYVASFST